ncbi:hypothetical protein CBR_g29626 [Chara braunii]|uniref:Uncharacterized protein n=1 Tax=Chara braunii TaxID=69332 RepID=A0A388LAY8_CHABU|nr:hypothetical protein CBR_g29626 [Chara braunii]|eukprot:GBG79480.1 hypothetical protein CBR_g29626 [Chara braunii]
MLPVTYAKAIREMFLDSRAFTRQLEDEVTIMRRCRQAYIEEGYDKVIKWDEKGCLGHAYILEHKDTSRWRSICASYNESAGRMDKVVGKAVNHMLWNLPRSTNFNPKSTQQFTGHIQTINKSMASGFAKKGLLAASFDTKDMFSKLSHEAIIQAVEWVVEVYESKGFDHVRVKREGKGVTFGKEAGEVGRRTMSFREKKPGTAEVVSGTATVVAGTATVEAGTETVEAGTSTVVLPPDEQGKGELPAQGEQTRRSQGLHPPRNVIPNAKDKMSITASNMSAGPSNQLSAITFRDPSIYTATDVSTARQARDFPWSHNVNAKGVAVFREDTWKALHHCIHQPAGRDPRLSRQVQPCPQGRVGHCLQTEGSEMNLSDVASRQVEAPVRMWGPPGTTAQQTHDTNWPRDGTSSSTAMLPPGPVAASGTHEEQMQAAYRHRRRERVQYRKQQRTAVAKGDNAGGCQPPPTAHAGSTASCEGVGCEGAPAHAMPAITTSLNPGLAAPLDFRPPHWPSPHVTPFPAYPISGVPEAMPQLPHSRPGIQRGRSPVRRSSRSPDRSHDDKRRRERRRSRSKSRSTSASSRRRRRSGSRDRDQEEGGYEFPYNKPAPGNQVWFTVELRDELYALRRELDRLKKRVDKLADDFKAEGKKKFEFVTTDMLKQAIEAAVRPSNASQTLTTGAPENGVKADHVENTKRSDPHKVSADIQNLQRQLDDMRDLRYQLATIKSSIHTPARRPFISPRTKVISASRTPKKPTPSNKNGGGTSGTKKPTTTSNHNPRRSAVRGMPQARVALRKIPGVIITITEELPDQTEDGDEVQGSRHVGDEPTEVTESSDDEDDAVANSSDEVDDSEQQTSRQFEPSAN